MELLVFSRVLGESGAYLKENKEGRMDQHRPGRSPAVFRLKLGLKESVAGISFTSIGSAWPCL